MLLVSVVKVAFDGMDSTVEVLDPPWGIRQMVLMEWCSKASV
jgi:hypothetical protein